MKAFSWLVLGFLTMVAVFNPPDATAQTTPPGTDIYLAPLYMDQRTGVLEVGRPKNITDRPGYDNQPSFTLEGNGILFTSIREWEKEAEEGEEVEKVLQADIFRYNLESERVARVTRTADSEYSPTPLPFGTGFSVVVVEADSTQRLWEFSADGKGASMVLESIEPVGYHAWGDRFTVALFVLGKPHSLHLADIRTGRTTLIAKDIGRSLHKIPGARSVSFLHRSGGDTWWIKELDLGQNRIQPLVKALPGSQDYTWTPDGSILMAQNSSLYRWPPLKGSDWEKITEFLDPGLQKISRLAVSPDGKWLALVAEEPIGIIED